MAPSFVAGTITGEKEQDLKLNEATGTKPRIAPSRR